MRTSTRSPFACVTPPPCAFVRSENGRSFGRATVSYPVAVEIKAAPAAQVAARQNIRVPAFPQSLIDSIPRRVTDPNGALGDRVNFILIGSQEQVQAALKAAGWVVVDKTQKDAVVRGLFASLSKEAYVTLPMSELRLFGRPQDFGYAQADPLRVVASRHHFRIWKVPQQLEGQTVWAGAGTHDIGFDRDQRNNGVTHKIDPATDGERGESHRHRHPRHGHGREQGSWSPRHARRETGMEG